MTSHRIQNHCTGGDFPKHQIKKEKVRHFPAEGNSDPSFRRKKEVNQAKEAQVSDTISTKA